MTFRHILIFLVIFAFSKSEKAFEGDVVIQVVPQNEVQLEFLKQLEMSENADFWVRPTKVDRPVDIHISRELLPYLDNSFKNQGLSYVTKIQNLQKLIDGERNLGNEFSAKSLSSTILERYVSAADMAQWLSQAVASCRAPLSCTVMPFGQSYEKRNMEVIKISTGASNKQAVFVDGGIHAREWISPVFVNNFINKLVNDYETDSDVRAMIDQYDWYIIPLLNPDGYEYSRQSDRNRLWRKNRAPTHKNRCTGVDLNRNFGYMWGVSGVSSNPCSEIYPGPNEFSEPESQALRDFLGRFAEGELKAYLTFHSYGQYFLYPWGYDEIRAPNDNKLEAAGLVGKAEIERRTNSNWLVGNSAILLYPAAGASDDYAYSAGAEYSYTIELPPDDNSGYGFVLPESEIPNVTSSVWPGVKALMREIMNPTTRQDSRAEKTLLEKLMKMDRP